MGRWLSFLCVFALAACSSPAEDEVVQIAYVGTAEELAETGLRLSFPAQQLQAATHQGLVSLDENGEVVPGIAASWIVTDDGLSYIFRLRDMTWPNGEQVTAQQVRRNLLRTIRDLRGTTLGLDLEKITEVRALTARVIEIELSTPMSQFLRLLVQPELGLLQDEAGLGPMRAIAAPDGSVKLVAIPPQERGLPEQPDWLATAKPLRLQAIPAEQAVAAFTEGTLDAVLGGDLTTLPLLDPGPLTRGTIRVEAAIGIFGLDVAEASGFLAEPANREAVAMAIDRATLLAPFNLEGWTPTTRIVPAGLPGSTQPNPERWSDLDLAERQAIATRRVQGWKAANGDLPSLRLALPPGPGSDILFRQLGEDLAAVGIPLIRTDDPDAADLVLRDRLARYGQARWFLNQFNCRVAENLCSPDADALVELTATTMNGAARAALLVQAESLLTERNLFIPLGAPIRWSLIRSDIDGFTENPWAAHPLFPLTDAPT